MLEDMQDFINKSAIMEVVKYGFIMRLQDVCFQKPLFFCELPPSASTSVLLRSLATLVRHSEEVARGSICHAWWLISENETC
jgi:hypothetical protein